MEQRISWWIVSSGERGEIVKSGRPVDSLSVVFPIGPLRSLARKPVRRPALCLRRSLSSPPLSCSLFFSFVARSPVASSTPAASYLSSLPRLYRLVLSFFLPLGERSRSTFLALATSLYVAFQCLRGELYCDCEDRRTSTKQQASRQGSQASVSARGPLRRLTSGQRS